MKIELVEYNPDWVKMYEDMKKLFYASFGDKIAAIEHIGSTSVPGLCAKPVIDIMLGVRKLKDADEIIPNMICLGFEYNTKYEDVVPFRRYFVMKKDRVSIYHIHTIPVDHPSWKTNLLFRDYLRQDPQTRDEYAKLKKDLARREWNESNDYAEAKTDFIRSIEKKAVLLEPSSSKTLNKIRNEDNSG